MKLFSTSIGIILGFIFVLFIFMFLQDIVSALSGIKGGIGYDFPGQGKWNAYFDSIFYTIFLGLPTLLGLTSHYLAKYFLAKNSSAPVNAQESTVIIENGIKLFSTIFGVYTGFFITLLFSLLYFSNLVTAFTGLNEHITYTNIWNQFDISFARFFLPLIIIVPSLTGLLYNRLANSLLQKHHSRFLISMLLIMTVISVFLLLWLFRTS